MKLLNLPPEGYGKIPEEELKIRVGRDFFRTYEAFRIVGNVDFCVSQPLIGAGDEFVSLLWAEAKVEKSRFGGGTHAAGSHHRQGENL